MTDLVGREIGHYRVDVLLGRGGMGAVYRAFDLNLARTVALKVMHRHLADQQRFQQRFMQEAQAIARLDHPSIINIYDFGRDQELLYMVTSFISGGNLADYILELENQKRAPKLDEVLLFLAQVADALGYAHSQGVVHRDIKPDNVMLKRVAVPARPDESPVRAVVTDFGLAKLLEGGVHTATGTFMGTFAYMSPEHVMGEELDGRSDIYSLGVMLYQLATGQLPFEIRSPTDAIFKHTQKMPLPPRTVNPGLPAAVEAIIDRALAKSPTDRFQKADELALALRRAVTDLSNDDTATFGPATSVFSLVTQLEAEKTAPSLKPPVAETPVMTAPAIGRIRISFEPARLEVAPGGQATFQITLKNDTPNVDYIRLRLVDLPEEWLTLSQEPLTVQPNRHVVLPVIIHPPLDSSARAGGHPFRILAYSMATQQEIASIGGQVQLLPFERFAIDCQPRQMNSGESGQVVVRNDGNSPTTFEISGSDQAGLIRFEPASGRIEHLPPGEIAAVNVSLTARKRPLTGRSSLVPFAFQVSTRSGSKQIDGRLQVKPRIPLWLLILPLLLILVGGGALGAFAILGPDFFGTNGTTVAGTVEPAIDQVATEEAAQAVVARQTSDAQATAEAEKTDIAQTAAAGDNDNDWLSNALELSLQTDPENPDSDGDGLLDGEEVNQYGSDPTEADTDGDGLSDGQEVKVYQTVPFAADTDGDGVDDGQEIANDTDPLRQPTGTPAATPTPTMAPTATPSPTSTPTLTPTPTATPGSSSAGTGPGLPLGFENFGLWGRGDQANGTITQSSAQSHSGGSSAKLSYDFKTADNDFVVFLQFNDIAGQANTLKVWVYGDGSGHYLNAWIIDAQGQTWQVPFGRVTHSGWAQMTGRIDTDQDWPWTHISGPNNDLVDYPIRFRGFVLDDLRNDYIGQGDIYLDDLTALVE